MGPDRRSYLNDKTRKIGIIAAAILGSAALFYLGGMLGQLMENYDAWLNAGGMTGQATLASHPTIGLMPRFCAAL